ncbi:MAG: helix-turn-helix transcriptional regulator [Phascolarctobacterium sp.]|uniref:helix-turn-helix domain-containing protein n=1 Tax=Phascolarctobacterium sp. TaxID=2049039 RepID=UPI0026DA75DD|nr:helix-turn-helix transcriptional regulator [Phascolarctobacterium sp.]MDO4920962.1 helix-turn-helix transcriptional regulator [Phascolarctobacterium sp.]
MLYKLKDIRHKNGITQAELAKKAGVTRATISRIESGEEVEVKISTLENLARVLQCNVSDFLHA